MLGILITSSPNSNGYHITLNNLFYKKNVSFEHAWHSFLENKAHLVFLTTNFYWLGNQFTLAALSPLIDLLHMFGWYESDDE